MAIKTGKKNGITESETALKEKKLRKLMRSYGSAVIAFSGGVDSSLVAMVAKEELGDKAIAVTATSSTYPVEELEWAKKAAKQIGIKHIAIESEELNIKGFADNPKERCYHCKTELFTKLKELALKKGITHALEGSNYDDKDDYRPGMKAVEEQDIKSPLMEAKLKKKEIRSMAKALNLMSWDKPSMACLSSRFPYGTKITKERLDAVAAAEKFIKSFGVSVLRVRYHDSIARIESDDKGTITIMKNKREISDKLKSIGFKYITIDIDGYRTGSMNETLR